MADGGGDERRFFGNLVKNQTKYGSTTKPRPKFSNYIKHSVTKEDTLQGIALKYGATVEVIKRENKLWTNDSLFLREHLYIPISNDNSHLVKDVWEIVKVDEVRSRTNSDALASAVSEGMGTSNHGNQSNNISSGNAISSAENGMDFFNKYDTSLATLKSNIQKMEKSSSRIRGLDNPLSVPPRRHSETMRSTRPPPRFESPNDPDSPVLVIRSRAQSSTVQKAVELSSQAQADLYQL